MLSEKRKEAVVELCRALIREKSYSGEEGGVAATVKKHLEAAGFDEIIVDGYGNVLGKIAGKRPGKKVLFDGHIDTVPVGKESDWTYPPFAAEIHDGKVYGRGATDMKGAVAAFLCAAADYAEDTGRDFAGEIWVAGVVHEECFEGIAARSVSARVKPDYVVIGEASECNLKIGQRGRGEVVVETFGVPAHSANPEKGVNAVYAMCEVVSAIRALEPAAHPVLGKGILELTDVKSSPYPGASVVPEYCRATYDRRLLVGETKESVLAPIEKTLRGLEAANPAVKAKVSFATGREKCYTGGEISGERFFPGWLFGKDEPFVKDIVAELRGMGLAPSITQYNFCTNGSHYAGEAGIRTVGLGPSRENLAHTIDEYVEISELERASESYYGILNALLGKA